MTGRAVTVRTKTIDETSKKGKSIKGQEINDEIMQINETATDISKKTRNISDQARKPTN